MNDIEFLEDGFDVEVFKEYMKMKDLVDTNESANEDELMYRSEILFIDATVKKVKKDLLLQLGRVGTQDIYHRIEEYIDHETDEEMKQWAAFALEDCRMLFEAEIEGEDQVVVTSPLGGKNDSVRYYFAIRIKGQKAISESNKEVIEDKIVKAAFENACEVEEFEFEDDIVLVRILIPFDKAPEDVIEKSLVLLDNEKVNLYDEFFITNLLKPKFEEIKNNLYTG